MTEADKPTHKTLQEERGTVKEKQDATIDSAIYEHAPIYILHTTQQDFLAGYKIACVDDLGVAYTVQCLRKPDELLYEITMTGPNPLRIKVDVHKAITCYEGLVYRAHALKRRRDPDQDSFF